MREKRPRTVDLHVRVTPEVREAVTAPARGASWLREVIGAALELETETGFSIGVAERRELKEQLNRIEAEFKKRRT